MQAFTIKHIDHIVLRVEDLERSIAFYGEVLGAELVKRRDDLGLVHLRAGRTGGAAAGRERRNVDHFCLRIEPFDEDALVSHLQSFGLKPEKAAVRFGAEGNGLSIYCFDPDGNQVELKGPSQA
jgi:catechol 2,3-dioxygenase-like lactoylglutathione lyase family enzyme